MAASINIGCSGWNYRHWRGPFYPSDVPQRLWFEHYARMFTTVEINNSFYRLPSAEIFARWMAQAPEGFRYAVKANRFITQAKKLHDCAAPIERMMGPTRALGHALGPILFQLPPRLGLDLARLDDFLSILPRDLVHVFEFRHPSWHVEATLALLEHHGAGFVTHDFPDVPTPRWACGPCAYVRFHGTSGKYCGHYDERQLSDWAEWIRHQASYGRPVWAYFNNDIAAAAPVDALALKRMTVVQEERDEQREA